MKSVILGLLFVVSSLFMSNVSQAHELRPVRNVVCMTSRVVGTVAQVKPVRRVVNLGRYSVCRARLATARVVRVPVLVSRRVLLW